MRAWVLAAVLLCTAAANVPEPAAYWTGPAQGPVPATIAGGAVIRTNNLAALLKKRGIVLLDVANATHRPVNLPATSLWMPPPHSDIPGSVWLPGAGRGALSQPEDAALRVRLQALTGGDADRPIIVYCHHACWLSWNAAKRVISYGYTHVFWYPEGVEGWTGAGGTLTPVQSGG